MFDADPQRFSKTRVCIIGAGMGGLAAALRLTAAGCAVTLLDAHAWPGGKMRAVPSVAGPVDAGPTVLTMRHVFDALFSETGTSIDDHVTLFHEPHLARHFWPDGSRLDLHSDADANAQAIERFAGRQDRKAFENFSTEAKELFDLFEAPMMKAAEPNLNALTRAALSAPRHLPILAPTATLQSHLRRRFSDPRLIQLFSRYATYVGGSPDRAPALLSLIWQAEAAGVWRVQGGMHRLAHALADRFEALGGTLRLNTKVARINTDPNGLTGLTLADGTGIDCDIAVFNGDPRALATGCLGPDVHHVSGQTLKTERSLSARVWSFASDLENDVPLVHHNVFFSAKPNAEFPDLAQGRMPADPTLYVCAEDRGTGAPPSTGPERFEIILNAAPTTKGDPGSEEVAKCRQTTFSALERFGLTFRQVPADNALTTPSTFEEMFPGSAGSLYGQTPHGMMAAMKRPRARTAIKGLYLAGGGTHPGAGVPMAALSGQHAAEAIMQDLASILK